MSLMITRGEPARAVEESLLARAAAAGDSAAFAQLYERYEPRVFNVAFRITGSQADAADAVGAAFLGVMRKLSEMADGDLDFRADLFAATHDACHEMTRGGPPTRASETPLEEIGDASMRLPQRQREALALRELGELSYEEIAAVMAIDRGAVAQLVARALINLRDEQLGTLLASVAPPSPECGRALPLIAAREEEQLEAGCRDAAWLEGHLAGCKRCRLGVEAMRQARDSYRAWAPIAAVPWLLGETMAKAAGLAGADWSEEIAAIAASRSPAGSPPVDPGGSGRRRAPGRRLALAAGLGALLLAAGVTAVVAGDDPPAQSQADATVSAAPKPARKAAEPDGKRPTRSAGKSTGGAAKSDASPRDAAPSPVPVRLPTGGGATSELTSPDHPPAQTAVEPTPQAVSDPSRPKPKPVSTPAPASQPASASAPAAEAPPAPEPVEQSPSEIAKQHEPPGKATGRPPR